MCTILLEVTWRESAGHMLQTAALVNEAYLRLIDASRVAWRDKVHFFAISANLMRRILVTTMGEVSSGGTIPTSSPSTMPLIPWLHLIPEALALQPGLAFLPFHIKSFPVLAAMRTRGDLS